MPRGLVKKPAITNPSAKKATPKAAKKAACQGQGHEGVGKEDRAQKGSGYHFPAVESENREAR